MLTRINVVRETEPAGTCSHSTLSSCSDDRFGNEPLPLRPCEQRADRATAAKALRLSSLTARLARSVYIFDESSSKKEAVGVPRPNPSAAGAARRTHGAPRRLRGRSPGVLPWGQRAPSPLQARADCLDSNPSTSSSPKCYHQHERSRQHREPPAPTRGSWRPSPRIERRCRDLAARLRQLLRAARRRGAGQLPARERSSAIAPLVAWRSIKPLRIVMRWQQLMRQQHLGPLRALLVGQLTHRGQRWAAGAASRPPTRFMEAHPNHRKPMNRGL